MIELITLAYLSVITFYVLYIAAVNVYYAWDSLALWVKVLAFVPMAVMVVVDVVMNWTLFTIAFFDAPQEAMVTQRLSRYRAGPDGWRKTFAELVCTQALNPFDPTKKHC